MPAVTPAPIPWSAPGQRRRQRHPSQLPPGGQVRVKHPLLGTVREGTTFFQTSVTLVRISVSREWGACGEFGHWNGMNQMQAWIVDRSRSVVVVALALGVVLLLGSTGWLLWQAVQAGAPDGQPGTEPPGALAAAVPPGGAGAEGAVTLAEVVEAVQSDDARIAAWRKEMLRVHEFDQVSAALAGGRPPPARGAEADHAEILVRGLRAAVAQKPRSLDLCCSLGVMLHSGGQVEEAVNVFGRAIGMASAEEDKPQCLDLLVRRGMALRQLDRANEARADERRAGALLGELFQAGAPPDFHDAREVRVDFGSSLRQVGLYVPPAGDSKHTVGVHNGEECWFFQPGQNYCYFILDPTFKPALKAGTVVRVEYAAVRGRPLILHYDGGRSAYTVASRANPRLGTNGWNVLEFTLANPRFRNSQNSRADLRLYGYEDGYYLKSVTVLRGEP